MENVVKLYDVAIKKKNCNRIQRIIVKLEIFYRNNE